MYTRIICLIVFQKPLGSCGSLNHSLLFLELLRPCLGQISMKKMSVLIGMVIAKELILCVENGSCSHNVKHISSGKTEI